MSTKSDLTTLITSNLADESEIPASKHRAVENEIADNLFPDLIKDTHSSSTVLLGLITGLQFNSTITKRGNLVVINGSFKSPTLITIGTNIFQFKISEYNVPVGEFAFSNAITLEPSDRRPAMLSVEGNKIKTIVNISANNWTYFNLTYAVAP